MNKKYIVFLLSGGINNSEPNKSLGGRPSKYRLGNGINNLFDTVTNHEGQDGNVDYRCFYIVNKNTQTIKDLSVFLNEPLRGNVVDIGFSLQHDTQILMVQGNPLNGNFQLEYDKIVGSKTVINRTTQINWVPDVATMNQRIVALLNSLENIETKCSGQQTASGWDFVITILGNRGEQPLRVVNANGINVQIFSGVQGGPVNFIAPHIGFSTNPPHGVRFFEVAKAEPHQLQKVVIGTLHPGDFFAVWLRRTVAQGTPPMSRDNFTLRLEGETGT